MSKYTTRHTRWVLSLVPVGVVKTLKVQCTSVKILTQPATIRTCQNIIDSLWLLVFQYMKYKAVCISCLDKKLVVYYRMEIVARLVCSPKFFLSFLKWWIDLTIRWCLGTIQVIQNCLQHQNFLRKLVSKSLCFIGSRRGNKRKEQLSLLFKRISFPENTSSFSFSSPSFWTLESGKSLC